MFTRKLLSSCAAALLVTSFAAVSALAQEKPGTVASLEFQTPKNGMVKQYEDGRKQKLEWHKQQKDSQPLLVWQIVSGDHTGDYIVGRTGAHWADFDKPSVPDAADLDEYNKVIGQYVQSLVVRYYDLMLKNSRPDPNTPISKFAEIITFHVHPAKENAFRSAIARGTEAAEKTKWAPYFLWYVLANGGPSPTYVLVIPHNNWADFEEKPDVKPFEVMLRDAFGEEEARSILNRFDDATSSMETEIIQFRPDLSYQPK